MQDSRTSSHPLTTRLAPSPTGALHLGNARTFLVTWALARAQGWRIVLRIEDLDTPRVKPETIQETIDTLAWLGMDWDSGPIIQSTDLSRALAAMRSLAQRGLAYPSPHTRGDLEASSSLSAPQEGVHEPIFPREWRPAPGPRDFDASPGENWRLALPDDACVTFQDLFCGMVTRDVARSVGDFVIWTKRGHPAYQLAVVVDDDAQGVTHVVRGDDLLDSAARQLLLMRALGIAREPVYAHLPLIRGEDGRRLAKRHGDTRIRAYRARGVRPERVIGLVAWWCGMTPARREMDASEFRHALNLGTIPKDAVTFTREDDAWLGGT